MSALVWVAAAIVSAVAAWVVGWPAWTEYRRRESRDLNAERYAAWRGHASRAAAPRGSLGEGFTLAERRRLYLAGLLAAAALVCLVIFFVVS